MIAPPETTDVVLVKKLKRWLADPVESIFLQVPRALAASVLALAVDFVILELCVRIIGMPAVPSALIGYLAGGLLQYVLCSLWVFSTSIKSDAVGFLAFTVLSLVGLGITWIVVLVGHEWLGLPVEVAKAAAVSLAFAWNFLSRKYLLFRAESSMAQPKEPLQHTL
jgi:putative flippase GtrA